MAFFYGRNKPVSVFSAIYDTQNELQAELFGFFLQDIPVLVSGLHDFLPCTRPLFHILWGSASGNDS